MNEAAMGGGRFAYQKGDSDSVGRTIVGHRRCPVTHLRKAMLEELRRRNLSKNTVRAYIRAVEEFSCYYKRPPDQLGPQHIREYQAHLFTDRKLDAISVSQ